MQLTPDYLISECGCPQLPSNATEYPANSKENYFPSAKIRFHNNNYIITSSSLSRRRLLPRRESLSDYYDKLLMNSMRTTTTNTTVVKRQLPSAMQPDALKHIKCAMNEAIRKADNKQSQCSSSRSQHTASILDSNLR